MFDNRNVDDAVKGIVRLVELLDGDGVVPPPILLCSGAGLTLADLARRCVAATGAAVPVGSAAPREGHVSAFVGDPRLACQLLGWRPSIPLKEGLARMAADIRQLRAEQAREGSAS